MNLAHPKPTSLKSPKVRNSARGEECTLNMPWCNYDPETTVLCHIRKFGLAGVAGKPMDLCSFYACSECHRREREAGDDDILRAHLKTLIRMYETGVIQIGTQPTAWTV